MSSLICCLHVSIERPRHLSLSCAKFMTLRATLSFSRHCTFPNQRRRPLYMTSTISGRFSSLIISSFQMWSSLDTTRFARSIQVFIVAIVLLMLVFITQHSPPCIRWRLVMASFTFALGASSYHKGPRSVSAGSTIWFPSVGQLLFRLSLSIIIDY